MSNDARHFPADDLREWARQVFQRVSVPPEDAATAADVLVTASLRGVDTHGIIYLPRYVGAILSGHVNARPDIRVERSSAATALMDGDNGLGIVVGVRAMRNAIQRAGEAGAAVVGVRNSTHFGAAAYYSQLAATAGFVGLTFTNGEPVMAPWGSRTLMLGNNPFAIAAPGGIDGGIVLDIATTKVAWGKLDLAARAGHKIPSDWATDRDGEPTEDPLEGMRGLLLPLGGHKGYGLSVMVEILCSVLTGAAFGPHVERGQNLGHLFAAIDVACFGPPEAFQARLAKMVEELHASEPAPGVSRIYVPGEIELDTATRRGREGIPVTPDLIAELIELGERVREPFLVDRKS